MRGSAGMMSEEETADDRKIVRKRPNWTSDRMNKWIDRGTDLRKVATKEKVDGPVLQLQPSAGLQASQQLQNTLSFVPL